MSATNIDPQAVRSSLANTSTSCLAGRRSVAIRNGHAKTIAAFVQAGHGRLLTGKVTPVAAIKKVFIDLQPKKTAFGWDDAERRACVFVRFVQRNRAWVKATAQGAMS